MPNEEFKKRLERNIRLNYKILNRLDPNLPCVLCKGPLVDGKCLPCDEGGGHG